MKRGTSISIWSCVLAIVWTAVGAVPSLALECHQLTPPTPGKTALPPQGWDEDKRNQFYHTGRGVLIPYEWFMALELFVPHPQDGKQLIGTNILLKDALKVFGIIPDCPSEKHNPYGLPIGMTMLPEKMKIWPLNEPKEWVGVSCAFCHTGQVTYRDKNNLLKSFIIDGGQTMQDNLKFTNAFFASIGGTLGFSRLKEESKALPEDFQEIVKTCKARTQNDYLKSFAERTRGAGRMKELRDELCKFFALRLAAMQRVRDDQEPYPVEWGKGRLDALGRVGNTLFRRMDNTKPVEPMAAPTSVPHLWGAGEYNWFQWNGSIHVQLARSISEAMGVGTPVMVSPVPITKPEDLFGPDGPGRIGALIKLENLVWQLTPPRWPDAFGRIDPMLSRTGEGLYQERCKVCHQPQIKQVTSRYELTLMPVDEIGTDATQADSFLKRRGPTGLLKGKLGNQDEVEGYKIFQALTTEVMLVPDIDRKIVDRAKDGYSTIPEETGKNPASRDPGKNQNTWRADRGYVARPGNGVWATAPFLHNGSIPTLYLLLSPQEERDKEAGTFCLDTLELDPVNVGIKIAPPPCVLPENEFKTKLTVKRGADQVQPNQNVGHEFRNDDRKGHIFSKEECQEMIVQARLHHAKDGIIGCELSRDDRMAIIEYMKTDMTADEVGLAVAVPAPGATPSEEAMTPAR